MFCECLGALNMNFFALLGHVAGLMAPALGIAAVLVLAPHLWRSRRAVRWPARVEFKWLALAGVGVVLAGLVVFGRDGKMLSYSALVLVQGSMAWWNRGK
jgi:hypothetical protein